MRLLGHLLGGVRFGGQEEGRLGERGADRVVGGHQHLGALQQDDLLGQLQLSVLGRRHLVVDGVHDDAHQVGALHALGAPLLDGTPQHLHEVAEGRDELAAGQVITDHRERGQEQRHERGGSVVRRHAERRRVLHEDAVLVGHVWHLHAEGELCHHVQRQRPEQVLLRVDDRAGLQLGVQPAERLVQTLPHGGHHGLQPAAGGQDGRQQRAQHLPPLGRQQVQLVTAVLEVEQHRTVLEVVKVLDHNPLGHLDVGDEQLRPGALILSPGAAVGARVTEVIRNAAQRPGPEEAADVGVRLDDGDAEPLQGAEAAGAVPVEEDQQQ